MEKEMVCIGCPMGCNLKITLTEDGTFQSVTGNTCKRGETYAENECTNPQRTLTTSLRCEDGDMIAVKTDRTIPKDKVLEAMQILNRNVVKLPVRIGDVLVEDVFGSRVVATQNRG